MVVDVPDNGRAPDALPCDRALPGTLPTVNTNRR
jgi:hypothetical protein